MLYFFNYLKKVLFYNVDTDILTVKHLYFINSHSQIVFLFPFSNKINMISNFPYSEFFYFIKMNKK